MGLFDHFPYTNVHELNLDWILSMMKALEAEWEAFTAGNSLTFADPMLHDISKSYAKNTIVLDANGNAYVSLQAVPVGVGLQNENYWLMVFDYEAFLEKVNKNFTARYYRDQYRATAAIAIGDWLTVDDVLYKATAAIAVDDVLEDGVNITHFTLEDFIKAFITSVNQTLNNWYIQMTGTINQYKNDIDASELLYRQQLAQDIANTTSTLQAQLDQAISGATVDSEVILARIGRDGVVYSTLGDAITDQLDNLYSQLEQSGLIVVPTFTPIDGYFINRDGNVVSGASFQVSPAIPITAGTMIYFEAAGYSNNVAMISTCDSSGNNITIQQLSSDNDVHVFSYLMPEDGYIRVSYKTSEHHILFTIPDYIVTLNRKMDEVLGADSHPTFTETTGYFINADGDIYASASFNYTSPVAVKEGDIITSISAGYSVSVAMISLCESDGTDIKPVVMSVDAEVRPYTYIADHDGYVVFCYSNVKASEILINESGANAFIIDKLRSIYGHYTRIPSYTPTAGSFINRDGEIATQASFSITDPIALSAGETIYIKARGYNYNVALLALSTAGGSIIDVLEVSYDNDVHTFAYTATSDCYVRASYYTSVKPLIFINYSGSISTLAKEVGEIHTAFDTAPENLNILSAFDNITCIGDSLTVSTVYTGVSTTRNAYKTYPDRLGERTGATITTLATGGANASDWWTSYENNIVSKTNQLSIIYLGTNDGLTDTMSTDMVGSDPDLWANTNTANYGRIIDKCLSVGSRVLLVKIQPTGLAPTTNSVIEQMAARFNVPFIENDFLTDRKYHYYPDLSGYNGTHYNDLGYQVFTDILIRNASNLPTDQMKYLIPA